MESRVCPRQGRARRGVPPPAAAITGCVVLPLRLTGQLLVPQEQLQRAWGVGLFTQAHQPRVSTERGLTTHLQYHSDPTKCQSASHTTDSLRLGSALAM